MHSFLYTSRALIAEDDPAHDAILRQSHQRNAPLGITGFLHREAGFFIQYLEGPREALEQTMARIRPDPRHCDVQILLEQPLTAPRLPDWQMGYSDDRALALSDMLTLPRDGSPLVVDDPFDLIVFVVANAGFLRTSALAA